ncbi:TrkA family potassium uptake protein [Spiroplasma endosymbiont of Nephrotoma flavescens]|uniref:potassium channel family protein n=1 Tax=Spiroplasma endosymbiont of Nephrotoma flavescens TaxID=3066302 RepID=UPI00313D9BA2
MAAKEFCIIGLGNFGTAVAETLASMNHNVVVIDQDNSKIRKITGNFANINGYELDATDLEALESIGIKNINDIIIAIGSNIQSSVLVAVNLKELETSNIIAKAINNPHEKILRAIGINQIVKPDISSGRQTALKALWGLEVDIKDVDGEFSISLVEATNKIILGKPLEEIKLINNKRVNIIHIKHNKKIILPDADTILSYGDEVLFIAKNKYIQEIHEYITGAKETEDI